MGQPAQPVLLALLEQPVLLAHQALRELMD
jgi:hypothetical protein